MTVVGDRYVRENKDKIVRVIKNSNDDFTRALAISALCEYGGEPEIDQVIRELEYAKRELC